LKVIIIQNKKILNKNFLEDEAFEIDFFEKTIKKDKVSEIGHPNILERSCSLFIFLII